MRTGRDFWWEDWSYLSLRIYANRTNQGKGSFWLTDYKTIGTYKDSFSFFALIQNRTTNTVRFDLRMGCPAYQARMRLHAWHESNLTGEAHEVAPWVNSFNVVKDKESGGCRSRIRYRLGTNHLCCLEKFISRPSPVGQTTHEKIPVERRLFRTRFLIRRSLFSAVGVNVVHMQ